MDILISGDDKIVKALERELYYRSKKYNFTVGIVRQGDEVIVKEKHEVTADVKQENKIVYKPKGRPAKK